MLLPTDMMNTATLTQLDALVEVDGKPVIDGRFALILKNPVNGFIRRAFIAGNPGSVYAAVLSFAREQWLPLRTVEYSVINTMVPSMRARLSDYETAAQLVDQAP